MDNEDVKHSHEPLKPHKPIETNYSKHQDDPGPSRQAVDEYDENGAASVLKWIIPVLVVALLIYWLFFKG